MGFVTDADLLSVQSLVSARRSQAMSLVAELWGIVRSSAYLARGSKLPQHWETCSGLCCCSVNNSEQMGQPDLWLRVLCGLELVDIAILSSRPSR